MSEKKDNPDNPLPKSSDAIKETTDSTVHSAETFISNQARKDSGSAPSEFLTVGVPEISSSLGQSVGFDRLGHYEIVGELGAGGMGIVYKAYDPGLKRFAALKIIRGDNPELAVRFVQEARAQARVQHECVCKVYEVGDVDGKQYIAMQLIEGVTLSEASKTMSKEEKVLIIKQVADALQEAHRQGLIHRDIKPSNIMLERSEEGKWKPFVLDFGLARDQDAPGLTRTGIAVGTPYYMSPEQVSGQRGQIDRRTDVYGLGATLYELLSGRPPYQGNNGPEILVQILNEDPARLGDVAPKTPHDLQTIVMKCLERDSSRRYESAKALSEDLQRFLDGDPIASKPSSWSYRLAKKAKKNPLATGILIAASLVTTVLVASFLWIQWQNSLRANYAREFDDEIRSIQSVSQSIYSAPLHDVRPELAELRGRLKEMEERVKQGGRVAEAPGNNALGQGYLALGEPEKARAYLEKSWKAGYQSPSTAFALGQTTGLLFQQKLAESERNSKEDVRASMRQKYEKELRDPAVQYLKKSEGSVESPVYGQGLIALYEKRYEDALKIAKQVYAKSRWYYDAKILEGKALVGMAQKKSTAGDYKGAIQQYQIAGEAYERASELGRSRADIYLSDCDRWGKIMEVQTYTDMSTAGSLEKAEEACNKAIQVNPDDPASYLRKANVYNKLALYQLYNTSDDPRFVLKMAMDSLKEAQRIDPKNGEPHQLLVTSNQLAGEYEFRHGIDPQASVQEAIRQANLALSIRKDNTEVLQALGVTYALLAEYQDQNGKNPVPLYEKAIQQYQLAEQIDKTVKTENEAGIAYWFIGQYQVSHGADPSASYQNAIETYQRSLKGAPDDPYVLYNVGSVYLDQGTYLATLGKDPTTSFRQSLESQQKAAKFIPNNSYILNGIGFAYCSVGDYLNSLGKDPTTELENARKSLALASQVDAKYYMPYKNLGYAESVSAQWAEKQELSPVAYFEAGRKALQKSIECNPEAPDGYSSMADTFRAEAEWQIKQKLPAKSTIQKGLEWNSKSLKMNAGDSFTVAIQGALLLLQAKTETRPADRVRYAALAATALEKAIHTNPLLQKPYGPLLKEAQSIQLP